MILVIALGLSFLAANGPSARVIDLCHYPSSAQAQSNWIPYDGALPVETQEKGITLPCNLAGNHARAYWDRVLNTDLSRVDRFTFSFFVEDTSKVSPTFNLYFQSGNGWYAASFGAERGWNQVTLSKSQFGIEDKPTGWKHISIMRVGAWKSVEASTKLAIADIKAVSSEVAVVMGDRTPTTSPEFATVVGQAQTVTRVLDQAGISSGGLADTDVEDGALEGRRVAIFPHNPNMSDKEMDEVEKFVHAGGRVIGFYGVHPRLLKLIGVQVTGWKSQSQPGDFASIRFKKGPISDMPLSVVQGSWNTNVISPIGMSAQVVGDWYNAFGAFTGLPAMIASDTGAYMAHVLLADDPDGKAQMMLALIGHFDPTVWQTACDRAKLNAGKVGEFTTFEEAAAKLGKISTEEPRRLYASAKDAEGQGKFAQAVRTYALANRALTIAYCESLPNKAGEMRAVWCHSAFGVPGLTWDQATQGLADNGINMVFPNMLWGGRAFYKSKLLPQDESVKTQGDQIENCIAAAKKRGIKVHVWKVNWNLGNAPADFLAQMRAEKRTQVDPAGKDLDWLCPSNPANFELERDSMLEVVRNHAIDGIHFDYIRYPGSEGCYCDGCRKRFEDQIGTRVAKWPQDVISGDLQEKYKAFRRSNITKLVQAVSTEAHRIRPGIRVSAAVFADWPLCRDSVGQDWVSWVKSGYLDFVCPMDYTGSATQYEQWMAIQTAAIGPNKVFCPGIGVTLDTLMPADQVARQIMIGRKHGSSGFILFHLNAESLKSVLPLLHRGITKDK